MQAEQITGYAAALFEVARAEGALSVVEDELFDLSHVLSSSDELRATLAAVVAGRVEVSEILELPAVRLHTVPGFETDVVAYATDVPELSNWGTPYLFGPGSIHVAHTDHEFIDIGELRAAVGAYERLAKVALA